MVLFPWKEEYSVNIAIIDEQHKKLLSLIDQLHRGVSEGQSKEDLQKVFAGLLDYMLHHFETEEQLMAQHGFPGLEEHKREHEDFRRKIIEFLDAFLDAQTDVAMDMVQYLVSWIRLHVFFTDRRYVTFLNERGVV